jgi:hypothetical protein
MTIWGILSRENCIEDRFGLIQWTIVMGFEVRGI